MTSSSIDWLPLQILVITLGLMGIFCLEYSLSRTTRHRKVDEERDSKFKSLRRTDVDEWARWKFYPVAFLTCTARMTLIVVISVLTVCTTR